MTFKLRALMHGLPAPCEKAKNTIKTKCNSVFFSLFIRAVGWSTSLCFIGLTIGLAAGLIVGLAIGGAVLMALEIAIGLSGWSLWKKLMSFLRC